MSVIPYSLSDMKFNVVKPIKMYPYGISVDLAERCCLRKSIGKRRG